MTPDPVSKNLVQDTARQILRQKQAVDAQSGFKMSKQGRKEPRRILFLTALTAIRCSPLIRDIYEEHLGRGKCKMDAIGVCMHKILRIIYGMLKHNTAFDPQAPISARQNKKRLERKQPQCAANTSGGLIAAVPEPVA
jgi:hypothetical protein